MFRGLMMLFIVAMLMACLFGTFYMSSRGIGLASAGSGSARQGSTTGPVIVGGGPGSGK